MANTTSKSFLNANILLHGKEYLCAPNTEGLDFKMKEYKKSGFTGCKGSILGMHRAWENCLLACSGQYKGKGKHQMVILKVVACQNLKTQHAFFDCPGALNDF